jgi:hypothetical protein
VHNWAQVFPRKVAADKIHMFDRCTARSNSLWMRCARDHAARVHHCALRVADSQGAN